MDQLKVVLEHKFWILAGLAILLPPIGWWAATDNLAAETLARTSKIESSEKSLGTVKEVPNEKWIKGAKEIGRELTASVAESQSHLFAHQKPVMTFPQIVQDALDKCQLKYRQDGSSSPDPKVQRNFLAAKEFFVGCYPDDWKKNLEIVKPFKPMTGEGLVLLPFESTGPGAETPLITRHREVEGWRATLGFTAAQMYDVQEDVWFLKALLQAIAKVNEGTTEIGNARIKRVIQAVLRGGDASDLATRRAGKPGTSTGGATPAARPRGGSMSVGLNRSGGGGAESNYKLPKAFDPDDIFGDDGSKETASTNKKDVSGPGEQKRWVEFTPKYNKRGFVLKLVMDEREIPTLLSALSLSPFPIEIRHVEHQVYGRSGAEFNQINSALNEVAEGVEQTKEQKQQQQRIVDGLRMAFNMNYLAEVTVAGTLTIYNEPTAPASKGATAANPGSTPPAANSMQAAAGTVTGKTAPSTSAKTSGVTPKSPSTSPSKPAPSTGTAPGKAGLPKAAPSATKTAPAGKSATTGK